MAAYGTGTYGLGTYGIGQQDTPDPTPGPDPSPVPSIPFDGWTPADPGLVLVGSNGDLIPLRIDGSEYTALDNASGFGVPPKVLTMFEGASEGATIRYVRTGPREIDLPIGMFGDSRGVVHDLQRRLSSAFRDRVGAPSPKLRYTLESGDVYEVAVTYVTGAEGERGERGSNVHAIWLLTLRAPKPYWTSTTEIPVKIGSGVGSTRGLLPYLSRLGVSPSQVLGNVDIFNPGDVPAHAIWTIRGPGAPFVARSSTGESFVFEDPLSDGDVLTVDTSAGTIVDQTGANRYTGLGLAPKFFQIPDGKSTIQVTLGNATAATSVSLVFRPRLEVVH